MRKFALPLVLLLCTMGCSPNVETRGHLKDPDWKERIVPAKTTREDVMDILGSPSARSTFGPEVWYYITTKRESYGFLRPDVTDEEVVEIAFEPDGTVKGVEITGHEKARDIDIASRVTPTEGHQMTFLEQLLGNLGRFNSPGTTPGSNPTGSSTRSRPGGPGGR